jgi:5'-nucleotidase
LERPLVLVTNDDGVNAPGLMAVKEELDTFARVAVYAPDRNWSAAGRTRTFHKPLRASEVRLLDGSLGYVTSGTPSDCISLALLGLLEERPRLIVSGINPGLNLGQDVTYSGTVAAAMEGARDGIPSMAISADVGTEGEEADHSPYASAAKIAGELASFLLEKDPLPAGIILNVNVPRSPSSFSPKISLTRLGGKAYSNYLVKGEDPRGRNYYWISGDPLTEFSPEEEGTDIWAVANGYVSITPIHLDMTEYSLLDKFRKWEAQNWFEEA